VVPAPGKIIKIREFGNTIELKAIDNITRETLRWFTDSALDADVNLENTAEVVSYCRYLIICLAKTEKLLGMLHNKDVQLLDVLEKLGDRNEKG
jgi:hypothetical protein